MINRVYQIGNEKNYYSVKYLRINSDLGNIRIISITASVCFIHFFFTSIGTLWTKAVL